MHSIQYICLELIRLVVLKNQKFIGTASFDSPLNLKFVKNAKNNKLCLG